MRRRSVRRSVDDAIARHVVARVGQLHAPLRDKVVQEPVERSHDRALAAQFERPEFLDEADARFAASIDRYAAGLTPWWSAAIRANAQR